MSEWVANILYNLTRSKTMIKLNFFDDAAGERLRVRRFGHVQSVKVVEGGVKPDEEERSADDPEDGGSGARQQQHRDRAEADEGVLLPEADFVAAQRQLAFLLLGGEDVTGGARRGQHEEQQGRRQQAVEEEDEKDEDVIRLEMVDVAVEPLAQLGHRRRRLEVGRLDEGGPRADFLAAFGEPFAHDGRRHVQIHGEIQRRHLGVVRLGWRFLFGFLDFTHHDVTLTLDIDASGFKVWNEFPIIYLVDEIRVAIFTAVRDRSRYDVLTIL